MRGKKQGILNFLFSEYKRTKLPKVRMSDDKIKNELKLINEKKSVLPSMMRTAVKIEAERRGIAL